MGARVILGLENNLRESKTVAQINEDQATMISASVHPAGKGHLLAEIFFCQIAVVVCANVANHVSTFSRLWPTPRPPFVPSPSL